MITVSTIQYKDFCRMEITSSDRNGCTFQHATDLADAEAKKEIIARDYVFVKLTGWLRQRRTAWLAVKRAGMAANAVQLRLQIDGYQKAMPAALYTIIANRADKLIALAPSPASDQFDYYKNVIVPVLNYCSEKGATI